MAGVLAKNWKALDDKDPEKVKYREAAKQIKSRTLKELSDEEQTKSLLDRLNTIRSIVSIIRDCSVIVSTG